MKIKLGELADIMTGNTPSMKVNEYYDSNDIPFIKPDSFKGHFELEANSFLSNKAERKARIVGANCILVSCIGIIGKVGITSQKVAFNQQINSLNVKSHYDIEYIAYNLLFNKDRLQRICNSAVVPLINKTQFSNFEISINKDIIIQRDIKNKLNLLSSIINNNKKKLLLLDDIVKSRFVELIYNNKLIYQKVRLKDCCLISSGATPSRKNSDYWDENGINWFKTTELKNNFLFDSDEKISKLGYEKTSVKILPKHTVLIAMYGQGKTRGMTGYLLNNATTNQACAALISLDTINPKYLWYTMINSYDRLRNMAKGGTQPNLSVSLIKDFEIILPPIDIQNKFTNYIEQINKLKADVQKSIDETQLLMDSLMQEYFG
ncbi:MAG: restriction endonuclease subunit S [Veillonella dispar]|nr:restriction endonuclease subunit S [Veillonella dispar]